MSLWEEEKHKAKSIKNKKKNRTSEIIDIVTMNFKKLDKAKF